MNAVILNRLGYRYLYKQALMIWPGQDIISKKAEHLLAIISLMNAEIV